MIHDYSGHQVLDLGPEGSRYRIYDPGGNGRVARILRSGVPYEQHVVENMASIDRSGIAVDVGANIGNHSLWLAMVCRRRVEAFEPIKGPKLRANLALNSLGLDRVAVHEVGLGDRSGLATARNKNRLDVGNGPIVVRRLDDYDLRDVALIKLDVEGMEEQVIRGGLITIGRERPVIYAEAWDDEYKTSIDDLLSPLGYSHTARFRWKQNRWDPR